MFLYELAATSRKFQPGLGGLGKILKFPWKMRDPLAQETDARAVVLPTAVWRQRGTDSAETRMDEGTLETPLPLRKRVLV